MSFTTDYIAEADTNSDKKVSDEERAAYEKKLEQQAQDKSGAVQKAYGLGEDSEPAVSATACLYFSTVLDPESDAAHENHFHLDLLERKAGFRYCH